MGINTKRHFLFLAIIFLVAAIINSLPWFLSGIPPSKQLASDAELHMVHWYQYSDRYASNFSQDTSFNFDIQPAGELFVNKIIVRTADFFGFNLLELSVIISIVALCLFLSGVYILSYFALSRASSAFIVGLGSIIPTFALGGTSWGFLTLGFLPRELALGFLIWIFLLFLYGKKYNNAKILFTVFFVIGIFTNWYPVLFLHFVIVLILADIIQKRRISKEHVLYLAVFAVSASFAIFDIISKARTVTPPNLDILRARFEYMYIFSFNYGAFHYLRRVILYIVWTLCIAIFCKKFVKEKNENPLSFWWALWISSGIIMTIGVFLEQFTIYAKFLFSRTSLFFIFATMIISSGTLTQIFKHFYPKHKLKKIIPALLLLVIFVGQSAIPTVYRSFTGTIKNAESRKSFFKALDVLSQYTTSKDIVLANTSYSNKIRAYATRSVYSSWKDGTISLLDGKGGEEWYKRFIETNEIFATNDLNAMIEFSRKNGITVIFIETNTIKNDAGIIKTYTSYQAGDYTIILLAPKKSKLST